MLNLTFDSHFSTLYNYIKKIIYGFYYNHSSPLNFKIFSLHSKSARSTDKERKYSRSLVELKYLLKKLRTQFVSEIITYLLLAILSDRVAC